MTKRNKRGTPQAHIFGSVVGLDERGMVDITRCVYLRESDTLAIDNLRQDKDDPREPIPAIVLQLEGSIVGTNDEETVQVAWIVSPMDAGALAGMLYNAVRRLPDTDAMSSEFAAGWSESLKKGESDPTTDAR